MKALQRHTGFSLLKVLLFMLAGLASIPVVAQEDAEKAAREARNYMKEAEEALAENDFAAAEAYYRQAIAKDPSNAAAKYNLGNLYYNKEIAGAAVKRHSQAAEVAAEKPVKHNAFHNQGNAFMKQKKYKEAVEAYKNALRNNPEDDETRYNLALAKKMLEEEQKNGGGGDDQNKDQNQENQDQNQDQQGDQGDQQQNQNGQPQNQEEGGDQDQKDKKEGDDKQEEQGKPQNDQNQEQKGQPPKDQPNQQQPVPGQLSPQQVKNLLEAMGNEEKKVQEKINAEKAKGAKTRTEKDW